MNTMVTHSTPAIVLGPTGNLQGTYKFFSLETGKKIKRRKLTAYPMPDSLIKQVEAFGKSSWGVFDFAKRDGILFEWNKVVDECPEGIVKEDVVLYPSLVAKFPGVTLGRDHPIPTIEEDIMPQGRDKAAAHNANMEPFAATGVDAPTIIHADINEINETDDDDDGIISVADIPAQADHYPLNIPDTSDEDNEGEDNKDDDKDNDTPQEKQPTK
jgi:hypothetical protein